MKTLKTLVLGTVLLGALGLAAPANALEIIKKGEAKSFLAKNEGRVTSLGFRAYTEFCQKPKTMYAEPNCEKARETINKRAEQDAHTIRADYFVVTSVWLLESFPPQLQISGGFYKAEKTSGTPHDKTTPSSP